MEESRSKEETKLLLEDEDSDYQPKQREDNAAAHPTKPQQWVIVATIILLQFCARCSDTIIYPFFPKMASDAGLSNSEIGLVFAAYDFTLSITSPFVASLVSHYFIHVYLFLLLC